MQVVGSTKDKTPQSKGSYLLAFRQGSHDLERVSRIDTFARGCNAPDCNVVEARKQGMNFVLTCHHMTRVEFRKRDKAIDNRFGLLFILSRQEIAV